jgi:transposase
MDIVRQAKLEERRKQFILSVEGGEAVHKICRRMKISYRTGFYWIARYRAGGVNALKEKAKSGRPCRITGKMMRWLYEAVTLGNPLQYQFEFSLWTLNIIRGLIKRKWGISLSKSSVSRLMRRLGLTPQRPLYQSYKKDPKQMEKYLKKTFPDLCAYAKRVKAKIFFVDESSVRSDYHRGTTWGIKGETPVVKDTGDRHAIKMISAVNVRGDMFFESFNGKMNSDRFIGFLKKLLRDVKSHLIIIADNALYHTSKKTKDFAETTRRMKIDYLPKYSPELNPDEQVWNHAKARLSKLFINGKEDLKRNLFKIMRSIQSNKNLIRSFFKMKSTKYANL